MKLLQQKKRFSGKLKERDRNTICFHNITINRRNINKIIKIKDDTGKITDKSKDTT